MSIIKIFFIITLFLFPLGELTRFSFGNNIAVSVNDLVIGILVGFWFIIHLLNKQSFKTKLTKPILLFVVVCILSLLLNSKNLMPNEFFVAELYLFRWVLYAGLYFVVCDFNINFKKNIVKFLTLAGGIFVFLGYIQYFFYPNLRNLYYAGWDEHLYRMFSTFFDPNFAGAFFVLYFLLIIGLFFESLKQKKSIKLIFLLIIGLLTLGAVFLTYSRSAYIMLLVCGSLFIFMIISSRQARTIIISLGLLTFLIAIIFLSKFPRSEGTNLFRTTSTGARLIEVAHPLTIFKDNPIFGVGFNSYRYAQKRYGFIPENEQKENHAGAGTDNSFLFVLATTGIVGFIAYAYLLKSVIIHAYLGYKKKKVLSLVLFCSVIGLFIESFFINSLFYPFLMEWIWILAALTTENT